MTMMQVLPKVRGFICPSAHPVGCAKMVRQWVDYAKGQGPIQTPKRVLVIGCSTGYGLASRVVNTYGGSAQTLGVMFERPAAGKRTASAGWYNTAAFECQCEADGHYAKSLNGDAFSNEMKQQVIDQILEDWGQVDMLVYSLASPRRTDPATGGVYQSVLKTTGDTPVQLPSIDPMRETFKTVNVECANDDEIAQTVAVMGGDDWQLWIDALTKAGVLADGFKTMAYSYIGPELTYPIYKEGTIGRAKDHLLATGHQLNDQLGSQCDGHAWVSVNKAVVTQASAAIPVVPLYISVLFRVMKEKGLHEGCIEQMQRLFGDVLSSDEPVTDSEGRIRLDDREMRDDVQAEVEKIWQQLDESNLLSITDLKDYQNSFFNLFGFALDIDYNQEVEVDVMVPSLAHIMSESEES